MIVINDNIWNYNQRKNIIVILTNLGYTIKGLNVMGAGLALQFATKYPQVLKTYGDWCKRRRKEKFPDLLFCISFSTETATFLLFPTKPLNEADPSRSFKQNSSIELIEQSCLQLRELIKKSEHKLIRLGGKVYMPYPGCGNGKLDKRDIKPILDKYFSDTDLLVLCDRKA